METSLHYNLQQKQLGLTLLEKVTTDPKIELRAKGLLNTVAGTFTYRGTLKKYIELGKDTKDEPALTVSAKKTWPLLKADSHRIVAKGSIDRDLKQEKKLYFQVRENNWALRLREGKWAVTYDL